MRVRKRWRLIVAVAIAIGLFGFLVASWWLAGGLVAPARRPIDPPPSDLPIEEVSIPSESGSILAGWYVQGNTDIASIVLLHPVRGSRLSMLERARLLHREGYSVLLIDMQAHGESPGKRITAGHLERQDAKAAVEYARRRNPLQAVGVVGVSLGGAAALLATPLNIDALVLESVYPTIEEAIDNRVRMRLGAVTPAVSALLCLQIKPRLGVWPSQLRPIDYIAHVGRPLLMLIGDQDRHTTVAETERMFQAAPEPKRLVIFSGAGHSDLHRFAPEQYARVVLPFLSEHLDKCRRK